MKVLRVAFLFVFALLAACSHVAVYNPTYLPAAPPEARERLEGKVLVYTDSADDNYVFSGPPTSFTGGATKLSLPLGQITREVAIQVLGGYFQDGAEGSNRPENLAGYRAVVKPKVASFSYQYNQLKNLGFAITPTVVLDLDVDLVDENGKTIHSKRYSSGTVEGSAYFVSGEPGERINQLAHETMHKLMDAAAGDIKAVLPR
jgi:hypothetical protein